MFLCLSKKDIEEVTGDSKDGSFSFHEDLLGNLRHTVACYSGSMYFEVKVGVIAISYLIFGYI